MEEQTDGILTDAFGHGVEHFVAAHLVFHQRISLAVGLQADALTQLFHIVDMGHPLVIDHFQKYHAFQLTDHFRLREFRFFILIQLDGFFLQLLLQAVFLGL